MKKPHGWVEKDFEIMVQYKKGFFMKKIGFLLMMALMLASGLAFISCWTTGSVDEPTQFEGRWLNLTAMNDSGYSEVSYTFTGNTFVFRQVISEAITIDQTLTGTFKFTGTTIRFTRDRSAAGTRTWTQRYTLIGNELSLGRSTSGKPPGVGAFTKQ